MFARYVRDKQRLRLEEAVHTMTGRPARKLRLDRRGELRPGCFADLVVFDPATIRDRATFEAPHQFAKGIHWVIVNGHIALDRGTSRAGWSARCSRPRPDHRHRACEPAFIRLDAGASTLFRLPAEKEPMGEIPGAEGYAMP